MKTKKAMKTEKAKKTKKASLHLTSLCEDVVSCADEVSSVEAGFKLGGDEASLGGEAVTVLHVTHRVVLNTQHV